MSTRYTGLAIDGFDPVAYFTDGRAAAGRPDLELRSGGASWRFANEGNRAAFAADPEVYARGSAATTRSRWCAAPATPGHPELWLIAENRLYLFYSEAARAAFAGDPGRRHRGRRAALAGRRARHSAVIGT